MLKRLVRYSLEETWNKPERLLHLFIYLSSPLYTEEGINSLLARTFHFALSNFARDYHGPRIKWREIFNIHSVPRTVHDLLCVKFTTVCITWCVAVARKGYRTGMNLIRG